MRGRPLGTRFSQVPPLSKLASLWRAGAPACLFSTLGSRGMAAVTQASYGGPQEEEQRAAVESYCSRTLRVALSLCFSSGNLPTPWNRIAWSSVKRRAPPETGLQVGAAECDCAGDCVGLAHSADAQTAESAFPRLGLDTGLPCSPSPRAAQ